MADDARETPPRLAVSDSRLLWERGVVLPPFEASQTWAVDLAVDLAHGRVQLMPPVSVSKWPRSPALPTAVRRQDTPGQLPRPRFRALLGALSALHFGISAIGAEKLLSRMPGQHTIR